MLTSNVYYQNNHVMIKRVNQSVTVDIF